MKIVDEPAEDVVARLRKDEIDVRREPYDPRSRDLLSDFVGFLRSPAPGSRVTLFEDDRGRVRYYTVERADPEVAELRSQVEELKRAPGGIPVERIERIEAKLERVDKVEARVERLPELEARIAALPALETKVGELGELRTRLERLEKARPG